MATKTNKSVSKRVKVTARGKLLCRKAGYNHFRRNKSTKQKRVARTKDQQISKGFTARLKPLLLGA